MRNRTFRFPLFLTGLVLLAAAGAVLALTLLPGGLDSSAGEKSNVEVSVQVLHGTVQDASVNTILVAGEDGSLYEFDRGGAQVTAGEGGIRIGCPVAVTYEGTLNPAQTVQGVKVLTLWVEEPPQEPAAGEEPEEGDDPSDRARTMLDGMSLEEKVGQMFIARCPQEEGVRLAAQYHLGGYILFARDFQGRDPEQVCQTIAQYQEASSVPMLIGVDEEGGTVVRVSKYPAFRAEPFPAPRALWLAGGEEAVQADTEEKCRLLLSLGINVNFAPVCDISQDPKDYIYKRTLGENAETAARYIRTVVETMRREGTASVLKHFPGYGGNADTHTGLAYDDRPLEEFRAADFLPFQAGIDAGAEMVLVSHNIVSAMDSRLPASLSPEVHRILREELGFTGVIVTDDLYMDGVRHFTGDEEAAVLAVQAGNDLLCCTDFQTQVPAVLAAVERGEITEERIDQSVLRILELKMALGLL